MKKLLGLLGAMGLVATTSATVVSCGNKEKTNAITVKVDGTTYTTGTELKKTLSKPIEITATNEKVKFSDSITVTDSKGTATPTTDFDKNKEDKKVTITFKKEGSFVITLKAEGFSNTVVKVKIEKEKNANKDFKIKDRKNLIVVPKTGSADVVFEEALPEDFAAKFVGEVDFGTISEPDKANKKFTIKAVSAKIDKVKTAQIKISGKGYKEETLNVQFDEYIFSFDKTKAEELKVAKDKEITVKITNKETINGLGVVSKNEKTATAAKGKDGKSIIIKGVAAGKVSIEVKAEGFKDHSFEVEVTAS